MQRIENFKECQENQKWKGIKKSGENKKKAKNAKIAMNAKNAKIRKKQN